MSLNRQDEFIYTVTKRLLPQHNMTTDKTKDNIQVISDFLSLVLTTITYRCKKNTKDNVKRSCVQTCQEGIITSDNESF